MRTNEEISHLYNTISKCYQKRHHYSSINGAFTGLGGLITEKKGKGHGAVYRFLKKQYGIGIIPTLSGTRLRIEIELFTEDDY